MVLGLQEKWAEARDKFRGAVEANPQHGNAWLWLGHASYHVDGGMHSEEEIEAYERGIATNAMAGHNPATVLDNLRTALKYICRDYRRAEEEYRKAIAIDPQYGPAIRNLAVLLGGILQRRPEARDKMAKAAALGNDEAAKELPEYERKAAAASGAASSSAP